MLAEKVLEFGTYSVSIRWKQPAGKKYGGQVGPLTAESGLSERRGCGTLAGYGGPAGLESMKSRAITLHVGDGAGLAAGAGTRSGKMAAAQEADGARSAVVAAGGGGSGQVRRPRGD